MSSEWMQTIALIVYNDNEISTAEVDDMNNRGTTEALHQTENT